MQNLAGKISFDANNDRSRFKRQAERFIGDWNTSHPVEEDLTLVRLADIEVSDEDDEGNPTGLVLPAVEFHYTTPSEATATEMHRLLHSDAVANRYNDILGLSVWYSEG